MSQNPLAPMTPMTPAGSSGPSPAPQPPSGGNSSRFKPLDPIQVLRQWAWLVVVAGIIGIGAGVGIWYYLDKYQPKYSSQALLMLTGVQRNPLTGTPLSRNAGGVGSVFMRTLMIRMTSDEMIDLVVRHPDVQKTRWFRTFVTGQTADGAPRFDAREVADELKSSLSVNALGGTSLIRLTMRTEGQNRAQDMPQIVDAWAKVFIRQYDIERRDSESLRRQMLVDVRERAIAEIDRIESEAEQFASEHGISGGSADDSEVGVEYKRLRGEVADLEMRLDRAKVRLNRLIKAQRAGNFVLAPDQEAMLESHPDVSSRLNRLKQLEESRALLLRQGKGVNHRSIVGIDRQMHVIEQEMKKHKDRLRRERQAIQIEQARSAVDGMQTQLSLLQPRLEETKARYMDFRDKVAEHSQLLNGLKKPRRKLSQAEDSLDQLRLINEFSEGNVGIQLQSPATSPSKFYPKARSIVPMTTMLFVGAALGLVFLKELLDQRIKSPADLKLLGGANLLGVVPEASEDPSGVRQIEGAVLDDPAGLMAECFRQVRTALLNRTDRRGYKTVLLVSPQAGSGTSAVASNLATSLGLNGRRVLMMDANFRRPAQHVLFDAEPAPGLVDVLTGEAQLEDCLASGGDAHVDVLPAGHTQDAPSELFEKPAFRRLLTELESRYDVILIDAPPALVTSDARMLAKQADTVAVVVRAIHDRRGMVGRMLRELDGQRAEMLGIILNGVRSATGGYFRKNYQEFYKYRQTARKERQPAAAQA